MTTFIKEIDMKYVILVIIVATTLSVSCGSLPEQGNSKMNPSISSPIGQMEYGTQEKLSLPVNFCWTMCAAVYAACVNSCGPNYPDNVSCKNDCYTTAQSCYAECD